MSEEYDCSLRCAVTGNMSDSCLCPACVAKALERSRKDIEAELAQIEDAKRVSPGTMLKAVTW